MILDDITMEQCLQMYENLDTIVIENGHITEIMKESTEEMVSTEVEK